VWPSGQAGEASGPERESGGPSRREGPNPFGRLGVDVACPSAEHGGRRRGMWQVEEGRCDGGSRARLRARELCRMEVAQGEADGGRSGRGPAPGRAGHWDDRLGRPGRLGWTAMLWSGPRKAARPPGMRESGPALTRAALWLGGRPPRCNGIRPRPAQTVVEHPREQENAATSLETKAMNSESCPWEWRQRTPEGAAPP